jgi:hypothetical protein
LKAPGTHSLARSIVLVTRFSCSARLPWK